MAAALALIGLLGGCRRRAPAPPAAAPVVSGRNPPAAGPPPSLPHAPDATLPPDYDPSALARDAAEATRVYLSEPRNPPWAAAVEDVIGGQLDRDVKHVVPGAGGVSMGCHTLSCLILVDAPPDKMPLALAMTQLVTLGPVTVNLGPSPEGRGQILFLTDRRMADPAIFVGWYRGLRSKTIEAIRSGKQANPLPVPARNLPAE
jgi:hypothetical protein